MVMVDVKHDEIRAGDTVAVAFRRGNIATLRVGVVQMVLDDERRLLIEWLAGRSLPQSPVTKVDYSANKIVRL